MQLNKLYTLHLDHLDKQIFYFTTLMGHRSMMGYLKNIQLVQFWINYYHYTINKPIFLYIIIILWYICYPYFV